MASFTNLPNATPPSADSVFLLPAEEESLAKFCVEIASRLASKTGDFSNFQSKLWGLLTYEYRTKGDDLVRDYRGSTGYRAWAALREFNAWRSQGIYPKGEC